jgi:N6-L-threonylcarbamoyladenine synthase
MGSLLVGLQHGKTLAMALNIPLVPVHHVEGHITAALLTDGADHPHGPLEVPYIALAVSGGHTTIYRVDQPGAYQLLAWTVDDAAGEAFDKVARILGLPYPGGVQIDRLAKQGNPTAIAFPRPMSGKADRNFSFSGLKTAVKLYVERVIVDETAAPLRSRLVSETATILLRPAGFEGQVDHRPSTIEDIAASFQEAVVDTLLNKTFGCAQDAGIRDVVLSGGVAANSRLRGKATELAGELGLRVHLTHLRYCTDNAAMIAGAGRFTPPLSPMDAARLDPFASGQLPGTRPCAPNAL